MLKSVFPFFLFFQVIILLSQPGVLIAKSTENLGVDARAREIFKRLSDTYASTATLSVDCVTTAKMKNEDGRVTWREMRQRLSFQRGKGFSLKRLPGSAPTPEIFYFDRSASVSIPGVGIVSRKVVNLPRFFRSPQFGYDSNRDTNRLLDQNFAATMIRELLIRQENEAWDKDVVGYEMLETGSVSSDSEHGVRITQRTKEIVFEFDIWMTDDAQPRIVRFQPNMEILNRRSRIKYLDFVGRFENWSFSAANDETLFKTPPTRLRTFQTIQQAHVQATLSNRHADFQLRDRLRGREIEDSTLTMLDGSQAALASLVRDKVVIIDFWASWSSMCVEAIPKWQRLLKDDAKFAEVVYLAVNQGEPIERVQQFVKDRTWTGNFAVDPQRRLGKYFNVAALPQTIIVNKEGRIANVLFKVKDTKSVRQELASIIGSQATGEEIESLDSIRQREQSIKKVVETVSPAVVGLVIRNGGGSGVIVNKDGLILTAAHVTLRAGVSVDVFLPSGRRVSGKSLGANHRRDAAMIQIDGDEEWPFAEAADKEPELGSWVVTMGHPGGFDVVTERTAPIRVGRVIKSPDVPGMGRGFLGTDCTITLGDSGGPLFDLEGRVIGIHSFISSRLEDNLHIPISAFRADWKRLQDGDVWGNGRGGRPRLGVVLDETEKGVVVDEVLENSAAAAVGIKPGDIIKSVGDLAEVKDLTSLRREMRRHEIGDKIKIVVVRGEETLTLDIELKGSR